MISITELIHKIAQRLQERNWQWVTAESCTGGLIASCLTEMPGSSVWFDRGFITYSNAAKQDMLGIPEELITAFGAVSEQVASAMASGALRHSKGHVAVSVTGIAGPDGGSIEKPVGTVCFGWAAQGCAPYTLKKQFIGNRQEVRFLSCQQALEGVLSHISAS